MSAWDWWFGSGSKVEDRESLVAKEEVKVVAPPSLKFSVDDFLGKYPVLDGVDEEYAQSKRDEWEWVISSVNTLVYGSGDRWVTINESGLFGHYLCNRLFEIDTQVLPLYVHTWSGDTSFVLAKGGSPLVKRISKLAYPIKNLILQEEVAQKLVGVEILKNKAGSKRRLARNEQIARIRVKTDSFKAIAGEWLEDQLAKDSEFDNLYFEEYYDTPIELEELRESLENFKEYSKGLYQVLTDDEVYGKIKVSVSI